MDVDNTNLTKQELDFLIERLSRDSDDLIVSDVDSGESATQTEVQIDLKTRLQRRVEALPLLIVRR